MSRLSYALDLAVRIETENGNTYGIYAQVTDHYSARNLLLSLESASRDRLRQLEAFVRRPDHERLFDAAAVELVTGAETDLQYTFDTDMHYNDFLLLIRRREEALATLHRALAAAALDPDTSELFNSLQRDCLRHVQLAKARYDLEMLA